MATRTTGCSSTCPGSTATSGAWAEADSELEVLELLANAPRLKAPGGRKENWDGHADDIKALLVEANAAKDGIVEAVVQSALANLLVGLAELTVAAAEERRRDGGLEFHDLLVQARALLRTHPEVTARLHATYTHLLIDEFQDTDPIQLELAVRIASDGPPDGSPHSAARAGEATADWHDWPVPPGRLFFVGDPKQAIYRFRRADVAVFLRARDAYVDRSVQLTRNHRSVPAIVGWVNEVFGDLIGDGTEGSQPAYSALAAHREPPAAGDRDGGPAVLVLGEAHDDLMAEVRAVEADELATTIARVRDEGWAVGEGDTRRPARLADVTVLIPTRASLPSLERALERAGLPYRVESSSLVYASPEVRDLLHVLRAVDDPTDQVSVVASLRSPWFGCGDDDLLEFHQAGGRWDPRPDPPASLADDHPVVAGLRSLRSLHERRWWHDASGLIELVLVERRAFELGLDERRPRDTWRRLRFVVDQARAFTDAYGADLRHYLAWADLQSADDARVVEAILPDTDDDAVRIMTVHASKGLEFPIVVLAGLNTEDRPAGGVDVLWGRTGAEVKLVKGKATAGYAELAVGESLQQADEQIRLLYVAATRARDHLVVSLHRKATTNCHAQRLAPICAAMTGGLADHPDPGPTDAVQLTLAVDDADQAEADPVRPPDPATIAADRERWILERADRLQRAAVPRTIAATSVARLGRGGADDRSDLADELDPAADEARASSRRGRAGTAVGRAVHAVLQIVDLATGADLAEARPGPGRRRGRGRPGPRGRAAGAVRHRGRGRPHRGRERTVLAGALRGHARRRSRARRVRRPPRRGTRRLHRRRLQDRRGRDRGRARRRGRAVPVASGRLRRGRRAGGRSAGRALRVPVPPPQRGGGARGGGSHGRQGGGTGGAGAVEPLPPGPTSTAEDLTESAYGPSGPFRWIAPRRTVMTWGESPTASPWQARPGGCCSPTGSSSRSPS